MDKQMITINGNNFSDLESFYNEIDKVLTKDLDWQTGHNLDAFNDILSGGFGVTELDESFTLIWKNNSKSKKDLGKKETIQYYQRKIFDGNHPSNVQFFTEKLNEVKEGKGDTLFNMILEIIRSRNHIALVLDKES